MKKSSDRLFAPLQKTFLAAGYFFLFAACGTELPIVSLSSPNPEPVSTSSPIPISPASLTATAGSDYPYQFQSPGGTNLTYSIISGLGSVGSVSGIFTAPNAKGTSTLRVSDSNGNSGNASIETVRIRTNGQVNAAIYDGTSLYIGGNFTAINPLNAPRMMTLDTTGKPLISCDLKSGFDNDVRAIVVSGSSIYVGGSFHYYQGQPTDYIAKLDASTCALDTNFSPPASNGFSSTVNALAISGTSLYVGGAFTAYRGVAGSANRVAKLDLVTGELDTTFSPPASNGFGGTVSALAVNGTSIYVGGAFTAYKGVAGSANRIAKLDLASGELDTTFSPPASNGFGGSVNALIVNGTFLYVGGAFTAYKGVANSANNLAKLDITSGEIDTTFSPVGVNANGFGSTVNVLAVAGTSLYVGGAFASYKGVANSASNLAKLDLTTGEIDTAFSPVGVGANGFNSSVYAFVVNETSLYVGGYFSTYRGVPDSARRIAKLDLTTGAMDTSFGPASGAKGFNGNVIALTFAGTTLYVGGGFIGYAGQIANRLAKVNPSTWTLDTTFNPPADNGFNGEVKALVANGTSLYVGGLFSAYKGVANSANNLAKLDLATGAIDTTFSPVGVGANGFGSAVNALTVSGTSLYVGGLFTAYKGVANSARYIAKLDLTTGDLDTVFSPAGANGFDSAVNALVAAGSSIYAAGTFTAYKAVANSASRIAKLDLTTGAIDTTFSPVGVNANGFGSTVYALATSGSSLYVGGQFTAYKGVANSAKYLAKLDLTSGDIDTTFSPVGATTNGFNYFVFSLLVNGTSLYVGGEFISYKGVVNSANALAKLDLTSGEIDTTFSPVGATANGFSTKVASLTVVGTSLYASGSTLISYRGTPAYLFVPVSLDNGTLGD
ncbi:MAG: hypothetical protein A2603_06300 [Bdellovibrionales bacterium RIFOXYD1_FULL_55_31]|nr:MAG: hypothetical protein A2603_06300 [Bdellovibrionales bacterium RIFOXYD1_FULL_55_31]